MQREQVIDLLRRAAASGDDWYRLEETEDGLFQVDDRSGAALVVVEEHWVEVRAGRVFDSGSGPLPVSNAGSLLRIAVQPGDPPALLLRGRVYLDGFSLHTLYCTVRDVLQLAGPLTPARSDSAAAPATLPAEAAVDAEAVTEVSALVQAEEEAETDDEEDAPPESAVSVAVDEAYAPVTVAAPETPAEAVPEAPAESGAAEAFAAAPEAPPEAQPQPTWETAEAAVAEEAAPELNAAAEVEEAPPPAPPPTPVAGTPVTAAPPPPTPPAPAPAMPSSVGATVQMSRAALQESLPYEEPSPAPAGAAQTCRRCGAQVEAGERFCINCGAPQPIREASASGEATPGAADVPPLRRSTEPETVAWRRPPEAPPVSSGPATVVAPLNPATCGRCGYENPPGNRFCQGCGSALAAG